ncbi:restriction endonuclease subunit S [Immundisolibacter cernigliae]|uniref:Type I restriction modification DNA specificity domain-containing protein n=1 Tax=Immundisolibacter cernigliae TaxID=1810504 RepID=A0A1B1YU04_9GAMM|nr:restriction endonuclease subunit S [Immundisolibacter cernigliae]ANX04291.1 hypothetical protein PG2T_08965 [Immundisolibacter cernigliae]
MSTEAMQVKDASGRYLAKAAVQEVPPGYKRTEVGVIPEDWEAKTLAELGAFMKGKGIRRDDVADDGVACIRYGEIYTRYNNYVRSPSSRIPASVAASSQRMNEGDLLFAGSGETAEEIGKCVAYLGEDEAYAGGDIVILRPFSQDSLYLGHLLNHEVVAEQKVRFGQGDAVVHISARNLAMVKVPLPPAHEQRAIAEALSDVDGLLGALEALIAKKRAIKQAAMQQLLSGKTRLPGFSGAWETKRLGDVIDKLVGGGTPSRSNPGFWGNEIPWVTVKDFATFHPQQTQESITKVGLNNSASHLIPAGTLITSTRMALGKAVIFEVDVAINQDLKAVFLKSSANVRFLFYWFEYSAKMIDDLGSGSTVKGISIAQLSGLPFPRLSLGEQTAIASVLSDLDAEIAALERRRDKTRALKQGMMQQLLTGRIRLVKSSQVEAPTC